MTAETVAERDARLHAWLANVAPGDTVTVRLNSTDTLTGKVYEAPDARGTSLCVWTTILRHGNGYPGGFYEPVTADSTPAQVAPDGDALAAERCRQVHPGRWQTIDGSRRPTPRSCYDCRDSARWWLARLADHGEAGGQAAVEGVCVVCGGNADEGPIASNGDHWCGECYREGTAVTTADDATPSDQGGNDG